jgi:enterochelin esterase-like enzyme
MKKCIVLVLLLLPTILCAQGMTIDTFFYSNTLARECSMMVYLPEGYDTSTLHYPVIYFLHGATQNWNSNPWIFDTVDVLINEQVIHPTIIVHPQGSTPPYLGSWYTNSELYGDFETYISIDVIEFIDSAFRTMAQRDKRSIMGASMGGYGAMKMGLKHPDIYCAIGSHSGAIDHKVYFPYWIPLILQENGGASPYHYTYGGGIFTDLTFSIAGAYSPDTTNPPYYIDFPLDSLGNIIDSVWLKWDLQYLPMFAAQLPPGTNLSIYFDCGTLDELSFYQSNLAFADSLDSLGIGYEFQSYVGGHSDGIYRRIRISMAFLDSIMQTGIHEDMGSKAQNLQHELAIFPNPFSEKTRIAYSIGQGAMGIALKIFDVSGRVVKSFRLTPDALRTTQIIWDGTDNYGQEVQSGIFFCELDIDCNKLIKKVIFLK